MYIAWKRESLTHSYTADWQTKLLRYQLSASLSESRRIDGKPRRLIVAHLGHIEEARIGRDADQAVFWYQAKTALDSLELSDDDRNRFESELLDRVPQPGVQLFQRDEFLDLIAQSVDAAAAYAMRGDDAPEEAAWRLETVRYVIHHRAEHAKYLDWWDRVNRFLDKKHRQELDEFSQHTDIAAKPFDYSKLDPDTAAMLKSAAAKIRGAGSS